jgi:hypothetical protein
LEQVAIVWLFLEDSIAWIAGWTIVSALLSKAHGPVTPHRAQIGGSHIEYHARKVHLAEKVVEE